MRPAGLVDVLAILMLVTAAYCLGRLVLAWKERRATHLDVDVAHVAMGVAMAGMLLPALRSLPDGLREIVFGALALWFAGQVVHFVRRWGLRGWDDDHLHHASHYVTHLAMVAAMFYMFVAFPVVGSAAATADMASMAASHVGTAASGIPFVFAFALLVSAVWYGDGITRFARLPAPVGTATMSEGPRFAVAEVMRAQDRRWLAPRLEIATHITMCFAMAYMLVVMR